MASVLEKVGLEVSEEDGVTISMMTDERRAEVATGRQAELKRRTEEIRALLTAQFKSSIELGEKLQTMTTGFRPLFLEDPICKRLIEDRKAQGQKPPAPTELLAGYLERQGMLGLKRRRIEQLMAAAELVREIRQLSGTSVPDPTSEGQVRALIALAATAPVKAELWQEAVKLARGGTVTSADVEAAIAASNCRPEPKAKPRWNVERVAFKFLRERTKAELAQLILALQQGMTEG